jgi:membrane protein DedA with SNARE-associated domain
VPRAALGARRFDKRNQPRRVELSIEMQAGWRASGRLAPTSCADPLQRKLAAMSEDVVGAAKGHVALPTPPERRRIVLDMPSWVPSEKVPRRVMMIAAASAIVGVFVPTALPFITGWVSSDSFGSWGYAGIFLTNFLGTATGFIPVPGLTAAGQALIIAGSRHLFVPGVIVAGSAGMTLAESTAYLQGAVGRGIMEEREMPVKGRIGEWMSRMAGWVDFLMARWGFLTLLVLSAIPNPAFEFAGIAAGAVRMNFWRFLLAVGIGKTIRVILLVWVGNELLDWVGIDV